MIADRGTIISAIGSVLYGFTFTFCTVGAYAIAPYTGKGPPGTYTKTDRISPAPPIAEIGPKIQTRFVKVETLVKVPHECRGLAERNGFPPIMTKDQARQAREKLQAAKQTREVRSCRAAIEKPPRDKRCNGPARYEAMSEGADCS